MKINKTLQQLSLIIIMLISFSAISQNKGEKIKALKISYITNQLDLSSAEAERFWPIYNETFKKSQQLRRSIKKNELLKIKNNELTEKEAKQLLERLMHLEIEKTKLKNALYENLEPVISAKKIIQLYRVERSFNRKLLQQLKKTQR